MMWPPSMIDPHFETLSLVLFLLVKISKLKR